MVFIAYRGKSHIMIGSYKTSKHQSKVSKVFLHAKREKIQITTCKIKTLRRQTGKIFQELSMYCSYSQRLWMKKYNIQMETSQVDLTANENWQNSMNSALNATSGSSPVNPAPGDPTPSSRCHRHLHPCVFTYTKTHIHNSKQ